VVHGKATILQKMSGLYEGKFPQARAFYMYMYAHPGKKLNFMGNEFAQIREWDEDEEQDWFMLRYPLHDSFQVFMKDLSHLYLDHPAFWALDYNTMGFDWVDCNQEEKRIYAFVRHGGEEDILCLFNFSEKAQDYRLRLDYNLELELLLASDADIYSGTEHYEGKTVLKKKKGYFELPMTPYSAKFFKMK
jgi:1,4-alpha-glucan branching enzyme